MSEREPDWSTSDGSVKLWLGDCLEVLPGLDGVDAVVTDPPYGIALANHDSTGKFRRGKWRVPHDDATTVGQQAVDLITERRWPIAAFASPRKPWRGLDRNWLVWDKGPAVGGGGDTKVCWKPTWELIQIDHNKALRLGRDAGVLKCWIGPGDLHHHPCEKPTGLISYLIRQMSDKGQTICDPFMGSGSSGVAAVRQGRRFIGIELDPDYFAVAVRRIQAELNRAPLFEAPPSITQRELI